MWKMLMKDFCRNVTIKIKKRNKTSLHHITIIPSGISYSRLNNFIALHMIATVWLYWASSLQLREQGVIIVPRACMCSAHQKLPPRKISSLISLMLSSRNGVCCSVVVWSWRLCHRLREQTLRWSLLRLMWDFLSLPCALTAYCPPSEREQLKAGALLYFVTNISSIL